MLYTVFGVNFYEVKFIISFVDLSNFRYLLIIAALRKLFIDSLNSLFSFEYNFI